jgi:hypothetical protein
LGNLTTPKSVTGERLLKNAEVDHHIPLFKVWRAHRDSPWPALLAFWGVPNLQVINRTAHMEKCAQEAGERRVRAIRDAPRPDR